MVLVEPSPMLVVILGLYPETSGVAGDLSEKPPKCLMIYGRV